jgi:hypothetical protein
VKNANSIKEFELQQQLQKEIQQKPRFFWQCSKLTQKRFQSKLLEHQAV